MANLDRDTSFFDRIKELVPLEDYLRDHCAVELVSDGPGRLAACCPFHEERSPSFKIRESDQHNWQVWRCYGGCAGSDIDRGTVIDAVMKREGFDESMDAARWVNEEYNLGLDMNTESYQRFNEMRQKARGRIEEGQKQLADGDSLAAKAAKSYFEKRGYTDATSEHFGLGVDTEMTKAGRLSIPLFDKENHPVSIDGRALFDSAACKACGEQITAKEVAERRFESKKKEERGETVEFDWTSCPRCGAEDAKANIKWISSQHPKYRFEKGFDKSRILYHQFEAKRALVRDGRHQDKEQALFGLFLTEGYADCWAGWQAGQEGICAYNGSVLSDWQAKQACEVAINASGEPKPIILIPDMDATGILNVERNIQKLRSANPNCEVQVVFGIDEFSYPGKDGEEHQCKDLGEVLEHFGTEVVARLLRDNRRPAEEWQIRGILDAKLADGSPFHSQLRQMELIAEILQNVRHKSSLDHLVPVLAARWNIREQESRRFFQMNHSSATTASHQQLISDIYDARADALEFLKHGQVIPTGYAAIDRALPRGGVRKGWLAMFLGKSGTGKAQPLDAKVLTPSGWKLMGEMKVGDKVVDPTGGEATVVGVFPQGERDIYRAYFSDGSSTECDLEHLWKLRDSNRRWKVRELGDLINAVDFSKSPTFIPMTAPVDLPERDLPVDPYVLGLLLGDGNLSNGKGNVIFSTADDEIIDHLREKLPDGISPKKVLGDNYEWGLTRGRKTSTANPLTVGLRSLGLMGSPSEVKWIPDDYLWASLAQRLAVLRGLMDTDGSVSLQTKSRGNGGASVNTEFSSASRRLSEGVQHLVQSLGGTAKIGKGDSWYLDENGARINCRKRYRVCVSMPVGLNPFRLSRKADLWNRVNPPNRRFREVSFVGRKQAQCIALDSEEQLYITDDFIVTHNTMMSTQLLSNMAVHGVRSIFFSLEQKKGQLYERIACQVLGLPPIEVEELILAADPTREDIDQKTRDAAAEGLSEVDRVFGHENLFIVDNVPTDSVESVEMSGERIEAIIREINMTRFKEGAADIVIIDHLGILKPGDTAPRNVQNDEMQAAGYIMERLFHVSKATDTFMLVLQQLPKEVPPGVLFAKDAGRGGSKQTDYCDLIFGAYRPEQEPGIDEDEKAARRGQYKLALLKNRYGAEEMAHLMFDSSSLRIVPAARVAMPDDDIADEPRVEIPGSEGSSGTSDSSSQSAALTAGLQEEEVDTAKLAADLGLTAEDDSGDGMNAWEWS